MGGRRIVTRTYTRTVYPWCWKLTPRQRKYMSCRSKIDLKSNKITKLCSALAWYKRWWNTVKGWFGSKPTNCLKGLTDLKIEGVDLKHSSAKYCSKGVAKKCRCKDLVWYKRHWNTIKGWFGSKPTNCNTKKMSIDLQHGGKVQKLCSALAW